VTYGLPEVLESFLKGSFPERMLSRMCVDLVGYVRPKGSMQMVFDTDLMPAPDYLPQRDDSRYIPLDCSGWRDIIARYRKAPVDRYGHDIPPFEEAGFGTRVWDVKDTWGKSRLFLPLVDFAPGARGIGLDPPGRVANAFWSGLAEMFPGKRAVVFDSGNGYHGIVETLMDANTYAGWLDFLGGSECVDQKWLARARKAPYGGVLRVTTGRDNRPEPKLCRWVNL
jgi:hypothetical protein